jgi:hypothetical protein
MERSQPDNSIDLSGVRNVNIANPCRLQVSNSSKINHKLLLSVSRILV